MKHHHHLASFIPTVLELVIQNDLLQNIFIQILLEIFLVKPSYFVNLLLGPSCQDADEGLLKSKIFFILVYNIFETARFKPFKTSRYSGVNQVQHTCITWSARAPAPPWCHRTCRPACPLCKCEYFGNNKIVKD